MNYRRVGKTGLKISEISIGGWLTYGGTVEEEKSVTILKAAVDLGINFIDLSDIYSKGKAEEATAKAIKGMDRSKLVISSKLFWPMSTDPNDRGLSRKHIMESVEKSLKRLGIDYLDIYFCHRFDPESETEETVRAMDDLVHQGKILYWGTSVWEAGQIEDAVEIANSFKAYRPVVEQPRYNMLHREIETEIMPTTSKFGMGLVVWSPLAQGLLTGKYNDGPPAGSRGAVGRWMRDDMTEENLAKTRQLSKVAEKMDISLSQMALAWILRREEISCAIIGATSVDQLKENVIACGVELTDDILNQIESILG